MCDSISQRQGTLMHSKVKLIWKNDLKLRS